MLQDIIIAPCCNINNLLFPAKVINLGCPMARLPSLYIHRSVRLDHPKHLIFKNEDKAIAQCEMNIYMTRE